MASNFEKMLAKRASASVLKYALGSYSVEVVDGLAASTVIVKNAGLSAEYPLESFGAFYSDADGRFYVEASGEELSKEEIVEQAIERFAAGEEA